MNVEYFVRVKYYQYNSGAGDNGFFVREEKNKDLNAIKEIVSKLKDSTCYRKKYVEFVAAYSGYVVEVGNIYKRETKEEIIESTHQAFKEEWQE